MLKAPLQLIFFQLISHNFHIQVDVYVRFVLDAVELQLPFFRNVSQSEFEQILPPVEKAV